METSASCSSEMRSLHEAQLKLHLTILKIQQQIIDQEAEYLEETAHGNIIRGWDGFIDSKQQRKELTLKKIKTYSDTEHLFSSCCQYATLAKEPTIDLVDYTSPAPATSSSSSSRRRGSISATASSVIGSASSSAVGTPLVSSGPGRKKRKRHDSLSLVDTKVEDDDEDEETEFE